MKVVINKCYGGFSLSPEATLWLYENGYKDEGFKTPVKGYFNDMDSDSNFGFKASLKAWKSFQKSNKKTDLFVTVFTPDEKFVLNMRDIERHNPLLVKCIEILGKNANGYCANLAIVEIPDGIEYDIEEYDGMEHIAETHRTWG